MLALTPQERRGALVLVVILGLGAARDLWRASQPIELPDQAPPAPPASTITGRENTQPQRDSLQSARSSEDRLDLNRASVSELDGLPGIGPVLAQRIADQRAKHGPFRRVEELLGVRGIGPRLFERLRPLVAVDSMTTPERPRTP